MNSKNISMIAAVDQEFGLGYKGELLYRIKEDMKFFREITMGKVVIMGNKTYETMPDGGLPNRYNVIVAMPGEKVALPNKGQVCSLETALSISDEKEVVVMGGASIYKQCINYADTIYLTEIEGKKKADAVFPSFNAKEYKMEVLKEGEENGVKYSINKYTRN